MCVVNWVGSDLSSILCFFFFFKQKTAYEMRISDWSSDVCSSDLAPDATPAPKPEPIPALDAHGHDPAAYDWVPVLKKRRKDGWSPDKQRAFIEALADSGSVATAAQSVGLSESSAYRLRRDRKSTRLNFSH